MKNISIVLLSILIGGIITGCSKDKDTLVLADEDIINYYYENKELINSIKDGLFSSGFIPTNNSYIYLCYDYENKQLFCTDDPQGEKLQSIQNIHSDAIEYFTRINEDYARISFRKIRNNDIIIEILYEINIMYVVDIVYTNNPKIWPWLAHIEGNWYENIYDPWD